MKRDVTLLSKRSHASVPIYAPFNWKAALWASLTAGFVFVLINTCLGWALRETSPWTLARMTAAIVLGPGTLSPSETFSAGVVLVAILVHLVLSIVYGMFLALVLPTTDRMWGVLIGAFYGLALYYVNFYGFNAFSPWFMDQRDWLSIASHFAFGAVLAHAYMAISSRKVGGPVGLSTQEAPRLPSFQGQNGFIGLRHELETASIRVAQCAEVGVQSHAGPAQEAPVDRRTRGVAVLNTFCPRLSEARHLLPLLRSHLAAAATRYPLPSGLALNLLPIVEDGLFGYELVPDRATHTYVTVGCNAQGEPVLRKTLYGVGASNGLRLVAVDGNRLTRSERAEQYRTLQRDAPFPDWTTAAEAAFAQLLALFPQRPRRPTTLPENVHRCLDEALAVAHSYLAHWNPSIRFCGIPNEAQQGYALTGGHGELIFQRPDIWMLRWKAPPQAVYESWSVALTDADAASDSARGDLAS
jgi:hypothetical protein